MKKESIAALLLAIFIGTGCASMTNDRQSAAPGEATYRYERVNADGTSCKVWAASAREVSEAGLSVDLNCELKAVGKGLTGLEAQIKTLGIIETLLDAK